MIKSLHLHNIQRHKDSVFEFHPGLNVICGKTDHGKSAVYRGFRWCQSNFPAGTSALLNKWADEMSVTIEVEESITRLRSKSQNIYQIGDGKPMLAGRGVSDVVSRILNMGEINFQHQKDQFYLLNENGTEVARVLNEIADLQVIDRTLGNADRECKALSSSIKRVEAQVKDKEKSLSEWEYLEEMEEGLTQLEGYEAQADSLKRRMQSLQRIMDRWKTLDEEKGRLTPFLTAEEELEGLLDQEEEYVKLQKRVAQFRKLYTGWQALKKEKDSLPDFIEVKEELKQLQDQSEKLKKFQQRLSLEKQLDRLRKEKIKVGVEVDNLEKQFRKVMPDKCPLCGGVKK